jgi:hypothetical protein
MNQDLYGACGGCAGSVEVFVVEIDGASQLEKASGGLC